jgi:tetratricopeptide (TPR) repeat protein
MKKKYASWPIGCWLVEFIPSLLFVALIALGGGNALSQDFGDHSSSTLTGKAWAALAAGDHQAVQAYVDKCCELYGGEAKNQQAKLTAYASGDAEVHKNWALNDVGTCLFIQGESLAKQGKAKEAIAAYQQIVDNYRFCQCWDPKGWFWKPAEASATKVKELEFEAALDE